ncbi:UBAP1-MVB12-associated (UMA)-domain containing protein 1 [Anabarilius grahami]|uniref:UBAP1-MVB12-associated (UMA)-domain containing protein 1 n=1 Tax=Anabarilius grahami TaxID=495550 RepID=A0A3N0XYX5_ANAGA|nr:UBAP1-MVB12-associated (UMA)-domain containing protein 1 [Anabarilius grahami]
MLKFFGFKNDGAKKSNDRETDGFVIIGETVEDQRQKIQSMNIEQPATNVIVQPSKITAVNLHANFLQPFSSEDAPVEVLTSVADLDVSPSSTRNRGFTETAQPSSQPTSAKMSSETQSVDATPALTELLGDIPFTLAPHILAMQAGLPFVTEIPLPHDINDKLANFRYDFSLENSVLCEP